jgi:hypothetical protein
LGTFDNIDFWKAIICYGLNNATYKIALGKSLLDLTKESNNHVSWETLSQLFLDNYVARLQHSTMPQQANPARLTVVERIITNVKNATFTYDQAIAEIGKHAFNDVIPRFHSIGTNAALAKNRFYEFEFGKKLILKDELFALSEEDLDSLYEELITRWNLLEGAFAIHRTQATLSNNERSIYLTNGYNRTNLANNIPFLSSYQGNTCFYCAQEMKANDIQVDHLLPRQVVCHDEIWNLVLAHSYCNASKSDKLIADYYFIKLIARNENIMGSNHPWKQKIVQQLGKTSKERSKTLNDHLERVKSILGNSYWGGIDNYIPEHDPFFKKLITKLNNG